MFPPNSSIITGNQSHSIFDMKLPLCITLIIFSLLLLTVASTIESRKELKDHRWKNVMEDESLPNSNLLFPKGEKPFIPTFIQKKLASIKDIEPQPSTNNAPISYKIELEPNTDNALLGYKVELEPNTDNALLGYKVELEPNTNNALLGYNVELEPNTDNALLGYKVELKPSTDNALPGYKVELEPNTNNALLGYKVELDPNTDNALLGYKVELEPNTDNALLGYKVELEPNTDNALLGYKVELEPNSDNALLGYKVELEPNTDNALLGYKVELKPNSDNALLGYKMEQSSPTFFQKKLASIKDIKPRPKTKSAPISYKMEQSSPTSLKNPIIRMVTGHGSHEINPTEQHMKDMLYFTIDDFKLGKKIPLYLPQYDPSTTPSLPKEIADSIPFSLKQLPQILNFFSFPLGSPQAQVVINALGLCERNSTQGETKFCATSMKSMVDLVSSALGSGGKLNSIKQLATTLLTKPKSHPNLQNYTLLQMPHEIKVSEYFACHAMRYPYLVRYCHSRFGDSKVLQFPMEGENGDRVQVLAVCHMDTSEWNPKHPSFHVLNTKPGTFPICHIFPLTDFVWLSTST